jgi:release factor glutamine methyltransferase
LSIKQLFLRESSLLRTEVIAIISHVLCITKEQVLMSPERELDHEQWFRIQELVEERKSGKPLAYLTHTREFFSEPFYVDHRVLIPRPETELLVEEALAFVKKAGRPIQALDVGTGSGIIGILIAKGGADRVICVDSAPEALIVAKENAARLGVSRKTDFISSDLLSGVKGTRRFDLVCANLPYVTLSEWEALSIDVKRFEPKRALVGGENGVELYARLISCIGLYLKRGAVLLCEIGSTAQSEITSELLRNTGFEVEIKKDLSGRKRLVKGLWTSLS